MLTTTSTSSFRDARDEQAEGVAPRFTITPSGGYARQVPSTARVLVVEADETDARLVTTHLSRQGFTVETVGSLADARQYLAEGEFELVLASEALPDGSGVDLVAAGGRWPAPVVLLADDMSGDQLRQAYAAGSLEVLLKDARLLQELDTRLRRLLELQAERRLLRELIAQNETLVRQNKLLAEISLKDPLTNVLNRRGFDEGVRREIGRVGRTGEELAVAYFDLDHFKTINDRHGHEAGDAVLKCFSGLLRQEGRAVDLVARVGGDEFAALLPATNLEGALVYADRVRGRFASNTVPWVGSRLSCTVSGGAALYSETGADVDDLLKRADQRLYHAKATGRNRIVAISF